MVLYFHCFEAAAGLEFVCPCRPSRTHAQQERGSLSGRVSESHLNQPVKKTGWPFFCQFLPWAVILGAV